jgi:hypothetical protein
MPTQRVIWTVLPNGIDGGKRKLSVLVSPRLEQPAVPTLEGFHDFRDWWQKKLTFHLRFAPATPPGATGQPVTCAAPAPPTERKDLWVAAFPASTVVDGYTPADYSGVIVNSYPVLKVLSFITGQYQKFASAAGTATNFPHVDQLAGADGLQQIAFDWFVTGKPPTSRPREGLPPEAAQLKQILDGKKNRAMPPAASTKPGLDFWQVKEIVRPRVATKTVDLPGGFKTEEYVRHFPKTAPMEKPELDFHKAVALLGDHPELLAVLGLIVDLEVPDTVPTTGFVWVEDVAAQPDWVLKPVNVSPKTGYGSDFRAQPKSQDLSGGFLQLKEGYGLVEVDVEGGALKLMNLANTVMASLHPARKTADTPRRFALPALRSAGLSLVRTGRAAKLVERFDRTKALNGDAGKASPAQTELSAEDLVRGYAIDVQDVTAKKPWQSLCRRRVSYTVGEGAAKASWPSQAGASIEDEGWVSLATTSEPKRKPNSDLALTESMFRWDGWSLSARRPGKHIGTNDTPAGFENDAETALKIGIHVEPEPKSLPRLRFGHTYLMRARAIDLAGHGVSYEHGDQSPTIGPKRYLRFEPAAHPTVVVRSAPGAGESIERIVIRSFNATPADDKVPTKETSERHLAPPLTSQLMAEGHGKFDGMDPVDSYALVQSRQGTYDDASQSGAKVVVHQEAQLSLPYLPDPLVAGAAFLGLPQDEVERFLGLPGAPLNKEVEFLPDGSKNVTDLSAIEKPPITLVKVGFRTDAWPDFKPFRLRLVEGSGEPAWNNAARELTVEVPKAELVKARLSSYVDAEGLDLLGILAWIDERKPPVSPKVKEQLRRLALQGRHYMVEPFRELVIVHAVQQPLLTPDISKLSVTRSIGSTAAVLHDSVQVHAKSTVKLDLNAEWQEWVDRLTDPGPTQTPPTGQIHAFAVPIAYPGLPEKPADNVAAIANRHELGDTKHRKIDYTAVATTRYREYFDDDKLVYTRTSEKKTLHVPSSARPAAPRVLYVVPTFGWDRPPATDKEMRSTRLGGGLRIYLERPWYSSGDDELLGIVLPDLGLRQRAGGRVAPAPAIPDDLKPYVTRWGADPIAASPVPKAVLAPTDFPRATTASRRGLTLDELDRVTVAVAAHQVEYDDRRQLWYCDIELAPGPAYFPFIRLALARYQPYSVEVPARRGQTPRNVHLSRVVLADFAQLAPDRSATVTFESPTQLGVSVVGVGANLNRVEVAVETQRPDVPTELGWIRAAGATVQQLQFASPHGPRLFQVTLPPRQGATPPLRLVVREFEELASSPDGQQGGRRLVYAEVFPL